MDFIRNLVVKIKWSKESFSPAGTTYVGFCRIMQALAEIGSYSFNSSYLKVLIGLEENKKQVVYNPDIFIEGQPWGDREFLTLPFKKNQEPIIIIAAAIAGLLIIIF